MATSVIEETTETKPATEGASASEAQPVAAAPVVPETYDLKVKDGSTVDAAFVERTAATARVLGLSNDAAQTLLDSAVEDYTARDTAAKAAREKAAADATAAWVKSWSPGGEEYEKERTEWVNASKTDPVYGGTKFNQSVELAGKAIRWFNDPELSKMVEDLGWATHPTLFRAFARLGQALGESSFASGGIPVGTGTKTQAEIMYPNGG